MTTHIPARPSWACRACGQEWPCHTRRQQLLAEFDRSTVSLALYLSGCHVEALRDLPNEPAAALHLRFVGWVRRARPCAHPLSGSGGRRR
jgi:hypothetical protein